MAETLALGVAGKHEAESEHVAKYLDEHLRIEHERAMREAALHDLHAEKLKLQSQTLRTQHSELHTRASAPCITGFRLSPE